MTKGSLLARHFPLSSFFSSKRARVATVAAAGTLTFATAISAAAAVLPATTSAASSSTATATLTAFDHRQVAMATHAARTAGTTAGSQVAAFDHLRAVAAEHHAREAAAAKAAAAKAAAAKAAAHKAALAKAAAAKAKAAHPAGSPRQIAKQMLGQYGWKASEFSCLEPLWYHESGWNPSAMNPSSGAYGIPQALHGSLMASAGSDWKTNPATQIRWGLGYIHDRYGSPCGAWAHEQSSNWY
jgi:hypothetical protein